MIFPKSSNIYNNPFILLLEYQFYRVACLLSILAGSGLLIQDIFSGNNYGVFLEIIGIIILSAFYFLTRSKSRFKKFVTPNVVVLFIIINAYFVLDKGGGPGGVIIFFLIYMYSLIIIPRKYRNLVTLITTLNLIFLFLYHINWRTDVNATSKYYNELIPFFIYLFLFGGMIIHYLKAMYEESAERLVKGNKHVINMNKNLEKTVEERAESIFRLNHELTDHFHRSSSDFKRPLTTIRGLYEVVHSSETDTNTKLIIDEVHATVVYMEKMFQKFQMLYEISSVQYTNNGQQLDQIIPSLLLHLDPDHLHKINWSIKVQSIRDDSRMSSLLEIILYNLIENAIEFKKTDRTTIEIDIYEKDENVILTCFDDGQGIYPEVMDNVLEMYFRGNERSKGNGLGLYVVNRVINRLSGKINVESDPGKFTNIIITIPIAEIKNFERFEKTSMNTI